MSKPPLTPQELAAGLSAVRWAKLKTPEERTEATAKATAARKAKHAATDPAERKRLASKAASGISPEAARARAIKAYASRRARIEREAAELAGKIASGKNKSKRRKSKKSKD